MLDFYWSIEMWTFVFLTCLARITLMVDCIADVNIIKIPLVTNQSFTVNGIGTLSITTPTTISTGLPVHPSTFAHEHRNFSLISTIEYWASIERQWSQQSNCPCRCKLDNLHRKVVFCDLSSNHTDSIPNNLDSNVQVFIFTGTQVQPKSTTLPRVFEHLRRLEYIQINYADVPSIGDATFWPGDQLLALNLSYNRIARFQPNSFLNLSRLHTLDLSHNRIKALPSGAFVFLTNLNLLSLSHNSITQLAPSTFLNVKTLQHLDLSHNPLLNINPTDLRGLSSLVHLNLAYCLLNNVTNQVWPHIRNVQTLDLTGNQFTYLHTDSFRHLDHVRELRLSNNTINHLAAYTFAGLRLNHLHLNHNRLGALHACSFCNSTIIQLDLSHNQLTKLPADRLQPLSHNLIALNLSHNVNLGNIQVHSAVRTLGYLKHLEISKCSIDDRFQTIEPFKSFANQLIHLNVSSNYLVNLSAPFWASFVRLQVLDISSNRMYRMSEQIALLLARRTVGVNASIHVLRLHDNPFRCYTCNVLPLRDLFRLRPKAYFDSCVAHAHWCVRCVGPPEVAGHTLHTLPDTRIRFCSDPGIFQRLYASEPRIGLIFCLVIIGCLMVIIVIIVFRYNTSQAVYYTYESKLNADTLYTIQQVADATAFSPSITSPSGSSPTHSAAAAAAAAARMSHPFGNRGPFSRQPSSDTQSQRDLPMSVPRRSLSRLSQSFYNGKHVLNALERTASQSKGNQMSFAAHHAHLASDAIDTINMPDNQANQSDHVQSDCRTPSRYMLHRSLTQNSLDFNTNDVSYGINGNGIHGNHKPQTVFCTDASRYASCLDQKDKSVLMDQNAFHRPEARSSVSSVRSNHSDRLINDAVHPNVLLPHVNHDHNRTHAHQSALMDQIKPPISEQLLCANVRTVQTQPIYSQPALSYLATSTAHPAHSVAGHMPMHAYNVQNTLPLDANAFPMNQSEYSYYTPTTAITENTAIITTTTTDSAVGPPSNHNSHQTPTGSDQISSKVYQI